MPQNDMNLERSRRGTCCNTCKGTAQVPGAGLVNGAVVRNGCQAAATRTSESTPAGTLSGAKPQCMVNGYINHRHKGKSRKAPRPRTHRKQESTISAVTDALAAGRVSRAAIPGGISVNGATSLDTVALPCNSDQMAPEPSRSAAARKMWKCKKYGRKKRCATYLTAALNELFSPKYTFMHGYWHLAAKSSLYNSSLSCERAGEDGYTC